MVITDLDGTLLNSTGNLSRRNWEALERLSENNIFIVIATGRSIFSVNKVIPGDCPIDYIVFSSGAGIYDWSRDKIIDSTHLSPELVKQSAMEFHCRNINYFIHAPIPENHIFDYYIFDDRNGTDAWDRIRNYQEFANRIDNISNYCFNNSCQVIGVSQSRSEIYESINKALPSLNVIRTTSPLDQKSLWIEVLPKNVSKASGCQKLCDQLGLNKSHTLGIGNDYNDLDLLNWVGNSFVVGNAPSDLKEKFNIIDENDKDGFSKLIDLKIGD